MYRDVHFLPCLRYFFTVFLVSTSSIFKSAGYAEPPTDGGGSNQQRVCPATVFFRLNASVSVIAAPRKQKKTASQKFSTIRTVLLAAAFLKCKSQLRSIYKIVLIYYIIGLREGFVKIVTRLLAGKYIGA